MDLVPGQVRRVLRRERHIPVGPYEKESPVPVRLVRVPVHVDDVGRLAGPADPDPLVALGGRGVGPAEGEERGMRAAEEVEETDGPTGGVGGAVSGAQCVAGQALAALAGQGLSR